MKPSSRTARRRRAASSLAALAAAVAAVLLLASCRVEGSIEVNDDGSGESETTMELSKAFLDLGLVAEDPEIGSRAEACERALAEMWSEEGLAGNPEESASETSTVNDGETCSLSERETWAAGDVPHNLKEGLGRNDQGGWWFRLDPGAGVGGEIADDGEELTMAAGLLGALDEAPTFEWRTVLPGEPGDTDADSVAYDESAGRSTFTWNRELADLQPGDVYASTYGEGSAMSDEEPTSTSLLGEENGGATLSEGGDATLSEGGDATLSDDSGDGGATVTGSASGSADDLTALLDAIDDRNGRSGTFVVYGIGIGVAALVLGLIGGWWLGRRSAARNNSTIGQSDSETNSDSSPDGSDNGTPLVESEDDTPPDETDSEN